MTQLSDEVVEQAKAAMLADLRDRRFLKYLFAEEPESCGAYGYIESPLDREVQEEILTALAHAALRSQSNAVPEGSS